MPLNGRQPQSENRGTGNCRGTLREASYDSSIFLYPPSIREARRCADNTELGESVPPRWIWARRLMAKAFGFYPNNWGFKSLRSRYPLSAGCRLVLVSPFLGGWHNGCAAGF